MRFEAQRHCMLSVQRRLKRIEYLLLWLSVGGCSFALAVLFVVESFVGVRSAFVINRVWLWRRTYLSVLFVYCFPFKV